jgi:hypothetical protein
MKTTKHLLFIFCLVLMLPEFLLAQSWSAIPWGISEPVNSMVVYNGELYVCAASGGNSVNWVKKWNGTNWTNVGTSGFTGNSYGAGYPPEITSLAVYNGELYAAGNFAFVDGNPDTCVARWNGFNWSDVPGSWGFYHRCGDVGTMAVSNNVLYVGGMLCGSSYASQRWDGWSWTPLSSTGSLVYTFCDYNNVLYAGCEWGIYKLVNGLWSGVGSGGPAGGIHALTVINNELYVGGEFTGLYNSIAKWNGSVWSALGTGVGGTPINGNLSVNGISAYAGEIYATGNFTTAGGNPANFIAKWNGVSWSAAGSGTNWPANALAVYNNDLYDGGQFWTAGGLSSYYIAKWNTPACPATITAGGSTTICSGNSVTLNANPGIGSSYQWKKNGIDIPGATLVSYPAAANGSYTCVVTNGCNSTSNAINVIVNALPSAIVTPAGPTTFCSGGSVVLNSVVAANRTYQWKKGTNLISGAVLYSYTATTGGNYKVIVTNTITGCSRTTTNATTVTINALAPATITPQGPTTFCAGGSVILQANTGTGLTYKWKKNTNFITGATLSNYSATVAGNYKVQVTNSNGCSKISGTVTVSVPCKEGEIISSVNNLDFTVYPNPNSGEFVIKFLTKPTSSLQIVLTDETGRVVGKFKTADETLTLKESNLPKGIYCLTATNKDEVSIKKINIVK